ncbi:MAG: GTPase Era, partial [Sphingobium sp.]
MTGQENTEQRCGVVAILGAPNAGKSTLVNALVGQKVAITSPKAQTTRTRVLGVALEGDAQIILVDTPGIFAPRRRLDRAMVQAAWGGVQDADLIALVIDAKAGLGEKVERILEGLEDRSEPKILILNKVDVADKGKLLIHAQRLNERIGFQDTFFVSAATGDGLPEMKAAMAAAMPEGPWHFPADQVSSATDRMLSAEITREQIYHQLHAELPYAAAVESEHYKEREDGSVEIHQQILVARASQRAIGLGKGGQRLKEIGSRSRA